MAEITTGILQNGEPFIVRTLTVDDLDTMSQLQSKVIDHLPSPEFLEHTSKEQFIDIFQKEGIMLGVFVQDRLVAFRIFSSPDSLEEKIALEVGILKEELPITLFSVVTNVDPDYRGSGLQKLLGEKIMETIDRNRFRYVLSTVAPFNIPSLKDKFFLGFSIVDLKEQYNGKLRYTFFKDFQKESVEFELVDFSVNMSDYGRQKELFQLGYFGTGIFYQNDEWMVQFGVKKK
ncbi:MULTISPECIES: hypothetical protein [Bacillaceae]|jgi:hypothetical protein|uniref:hypothetical protein n=1 Tax=Bacillaceae TaxID=186817 RepID=UPI001C100A01|nr:MULTISPECIES: hypothetical protein [Bacillaceae]MBU5340585.1 hypothetical protein [Caldifermentibacillus hisashii]MCM3476660.1 hypothetical protein [Caldibacillus thermoamylovorans]MEC5273839.1 hypothetical protein [Caldifermentibacillus hisashii]